MSITMITVCIQGHEHKQLFLSLDRWMAGCPARLVNAAKSTLNHVKVAVELLMFQEKDTRCSQHSYKYDSLQSYLKLCKTLMENTENINVNNVQ